MIISLIAFVLATFGYEEEIRENCEWLFSIDKGECVQEISNDIFSQLEWEEKSRRGFVAGEDSVFISLFSNAGNGAALVLFRKSESGYVFVDEFTSLFGGNGIEFSVSHPEHDHR